MNILSEKLENVKSFLVILQNDLTSSDGSTPENILASALNVVIGYIESEDKSYE